MGRGYHSDLTSKLPSFAKYTFNIKCLRVMSVCFKKAPYLFQNEQYTRVD